MRFGCLTAVVFGMTLIACEDLDTGRMVGRDEGKQKIDRTTGPEGTATRDAGRDGPGTTGTAGTTDAPAAMPPRMTPASAGFAPMLDPTRPNGPRADRFVAYVRGTTANPKVTGTVQFRPTGAGMEVQADLQGLPAGTYTYVVSTWGDCSAPERNSAGPPLDLAALARMSGQPGGAAVTGSTGTPGTTGTTPSTLPPGTLPPGGMPPGTLPPGTLPPATVPGALPPGSVAVASNTGTLGTIEATASGEARARSTLTTLTSQDVGALAARAVVIYPGERGKAPAGAAGAAGEALACGVIGIAGDTRAPATPTSIAPLSD